MAASPKDIFEQALHLNDADRAALAGLLLESLDTESEEGVEAAWLAEVEQRMAALDSAAVKAVPWEDVQARLLNRLDASTRR